MCKMFARCVQDVCKMCTRCVQDMRKTFARCVQVVLNMCARCVQDVCKVCARCAQDVCKMYALMIYIMFDIIEPHTFRKYSTFWVLEKSEEPCRILKKFVHASVVNVIHAKVMPGSVLYTEH